MEDFPVFTLEEANVALTEVIRLTEATVARLEENRFPYESLGLRKYNALHNLTQEDLIKVEWAREIAALGIYPKGYFVVDFQSPEPDTFYCWQVGETEITHTHKKWETFADRRLLSRPERKPSDKSYDSL